MPLKLLTTFYDFDRVGAGFSTADEDEDDYYDNDEEVDYTYSDTSP